MKDNYLEINKESWNERTKVHVDSDFYDNKTFLKGRSSLNEIELDLLGDIAGKKVLHLQCHFGQDSISLARMGADVTGIDLSDEAIKTATELSNQTHTPVRFIESDVYSLPQMLQDSFDIVFTSYGTIGWLPDIDEWARVVSHFMRSGGVFIFAEFHPVLWMFDDDFEKVAYTYHKSDPIVETTSGTYGDPDANITITSKSWNHGMAEVVTALLNEGLNLVAMREFDYSPYDCLRGMVEVAPGKFQIEKMKGKIPMVYALKMKKASK